MLHGLPYTLTKTSNSGVCCNRKWYVSVIWRFYMLSKLSTYGPITLTKNIQSIPRILLNSIKVLRITCSILIHIHRSWIIYCFIKNNVNMHYMNHCWLIINSVLRHSLQRDFIRLRCSWICSGMSFLNYHRISQGPTHIYLYPLAFLLLTLWKYICHTRTPLYT